MKKIKKEIKGITLVALVVTIIVLLILSGVAISLSIGEDGIFKRAQDASKIYENASQNELIEIEKVSNYIDDYWNEKNDDEEIEKSEIEIAINEGKVFEKNTIIYDKFKNAVKIPAGFKLSTDSGKTVLEGVVIEDVEAGDETSKGNQYVWVPVGEINNGSEKLEIKLGRYTYEYPTGNKILEQSADDYTNVITIDPSYQELSSSSYGNTVAYSLKDFIEKTKASGGYYIGRYEVGDEYATEKRNSNSGIMGIPVIKKDKWPYTFVTQNEAAELAKSIYDSNNNFSSDLVNSYAYDTAIVFIQEVSEYKSYSQETALSSELTTTGNAHDETNNYDVKCNIYDLGGNTYEWSTETFTNKDNPYVVRGGDFFHESYFAGVRHSSAVISEDSYPAFRAILYL